MLDDIGKHLCGTGKLSSWIWRMVARTNQGTEVNADEAQQQNLEQRRFEESIEASRKLSHEFKAESKSDDEHHRLFFKRMNRSTTR